VTTYKQRDLVLVPFPFSDLSGQKVRPVLVLSNNRYNQKSADAVVCGITTNLKSAPYSVLLDVTDVEAAGTLRHKSRIKADTIASLDQSIFIKVIARLKPAHFKLVVAEIETLFSAA
jgi:mRNA interferase MazF